MDKIGIIAGDGKLPILVGESLIKKNYDICFFCIKHFVNFNNYKKYDNLEIKLNSFTDILKFLKQKKIDKIIMVGKIKRPSINEIKFDMNALFLIKEYLLESKGDDQLLRSISNFFLKKGYPLFDWRKVCIELFALKENLTNLKPSKIATQNKDKGLKVFKMIGKADIGQSIIIQNQLILGIECIEGTDELIIRSDKYKTKGDKGILLKLSKYNQHSILDVPTIGLKTVKLIKEYNYEGLFIEKNICLIVEKEKVINFCNENNIFLSTVEKIETK